MQKVEIVRLNMDIADGCQKKLKIDRTVGNFYILLPQYRSFK